MGDLLRFDDSALNAQMQMRGIKKKKRNFLLAGLMIMENSAITYIADNQKNGW